MSHTIWKAVCAAMLAVTMVIPLLGEPATVNESIGSRSAPITIEVYADYQCPQCRNLYLTTTRQVIDNYVVTGKVLLVHHDFPLPMHAHSREAALWADAAATLGSRQFQAVENALYSKQDDWGSTGKIEAAIAPALSSADLGKVKAEIKAHASDLNAGIARSIAEGNARRVNATPTIFVAYKGKTTPLPPGSISYALLKQYLDYLLQH